MIALKIIAWVNFIAGALLVVWAIQSQTPLPIAFAASAIVSGFLFLGFDRALVILDEIRYHLAGHDPDTGRDALKCLAEIRDRLPRDPAG